MVFYSTYVHELLIGQLCALVVTRLYTAFSLTRGGEESVLTPPQGSKAPPWNSAVPHMTSGIIAYVTLGDART